jgi:hypothetical protein
MANTTPAPSETPGDGTNPPTETVTTVPNGETPASTTPASTTPDDTQKQIDELKAALKKANAESATHRHKANELDKLKADAEAASLSEAEKTQKKLAALQAQYDTTLREKQEIATNAEVRIQAIQMGMDPRAASKLLDSSAIERDESGNPTNVPALLKELIKEYPTLFSKTPPPPPPTSGGPTNPPRSQSSDGEITAVYVNDVMSGKIAWDTLTPERRVAVLNWKARNPYRF